MLTDPDPEGILEGSETWRLPAKEIETVVINGVIGFFENKVKLLDAMNVDDYDVGKVLSGAAKLAIQLRSDDTSEQRKILLGLMDHTIVCKSHIRVVFHPSQIHEHFGTSPSDSLNTLTEIDIAVAFRRRGVEKRIVIRDERLARREPDPKLIELIAQAHVWFVELTTGDTSSVRELATKYDVDQGDVSRILSLAFLAPDIVEAIVAGSQPVELTPRRIKRLSDLPFSWVDQHQHLGFIRHNT